MQTKFRHRAVRGMLLAGLLAANAHSAVHIGPGCAYARIQDAIDALAPGETDYRVATGTYRENLFFNSPFASNRLRVAGGYVGCTDTVVDDPEATIIDASGTNHSVVSITGIVDATFANLTITGGNAPQGGGILISGGGQLALDAVRVSANAAQTGGGVFAIGSAGLLTVRIGERTLISGNTVSVRGGGVLIAGTSRLLMNAPQSAIAYNASLSDDADAGGGGLAIAGPARADIGSGGYYNVAADAWYGAVSHNNAARGGGIDVRGGGTLRIYSTDALRPLALHDNHALSQGGAIFADGAGSAVCAWNVTIRADEANEGAALFAVGANVAFRRDSVFEQCGPESALDLGAIDCSAGTPCNRIDDNIGNVSIVTAASTTIFQADRLAMNGNLAPTGALFRSEQLLGLQNCLLARNPVLYVARWSGNLYMDGCTVADNITTGVNEVFRATTDSSLDLVESIVIGDDYVLDPRLAPASAWVSDVITSHAAQLCLDDCNGVTEGDPRFVDATAGDYHLDAGSPAIDRASAGPRLDLDGQLRGLPASPAGSGHSFDLGAFEAAAGTPGDDVFHDGFERAS
jgi:hypothetical protein